MLSNLFKSLRWTSKIFAVLVFVLITNHGLALRLNFLLENKNYSTLVVFIGLWLFSIFAIFVAAYQQQWWKRLVWALVISVTTGVSYGFYIAGGSELEVLDVLELWQARHETGRAFEHFQHALFKAVIVALIGFVVIVFPPPKIIGKSKKMLSLFWWVPLIPILLFSILIFVKSDTAIEGLPQQFAPASMATAILYKLSTHQLPQRSEVEEAPNEPAKVKHILYLIDESINPNYLYTSDKKLIEGLSDNHEKVANFGVSISGSNCSARSNAILRLGAKRNDLIESIKTSPTIWQFAKKAGFRTVYIDAQASEKIIKKPNDFQNYMNTAEAKFIDKFYKVKDVPATQLDYRLLELVKAELESEIPTFIYANKNGAHFPYNENYPENETVFQPAFTANPSRGLGGLFDLYNSGGGLQTVINTYKNSINWTVNKFFKRFFGEINLDNTMVIYTSDHGQYFRENSTTHCTSGEGAPPAEGIVPLMLMTNKPSLLANFKKAASQNYNRTDHFSLFPTLLNMFGYEKSIQNKYGNTILELATAQTTAFNTGDILGIITIDTIWTEVNAEQKLLNTPNIPIKQ